MALTVTEVQTGTWMVKGGHAGDIYLTTLEQAYERQQTAHSQFEYTEKRKTDYAAQAAHYHDIHVAIDDGTLQPIDGTTDQYLITSPEGHMYIDTEAGNDQKEDIAHANEQHMVTVDLPFYHNEIEETEELINLIK